MSDRFKPITEALNTQLAKMRQEMPEVMNGFSALAQSATKPGILDKKTKELIAISLAVASHCHGCVGFHAKALVELNTSRAELLEALGMAIYMGGGPSLMFAADALQAFEEFEKT